MRLLQQLREENRRKKEKKLRAQNVAGKEGWLCWTTINAAAAAAAELIQLTSELPFI